MALYRFAYTETNIGFADVEAGSLEEAREKLNEGYIDLFINKTDSSFGDLIETID